MTKFLYAMLYAALHDVAVRRSHGTLHRFPKMDVWEMRDLAAWLNARIS